MPASVQPVSPAAPGFVLDDLLSSLATEAANTTAFGDTDEVEATEPTTVVPDEELPAEEAKEPEVAPEAVLPEGTVLVPKIDRPLVTEFAVKDKDGDIEIPDVTITFMANGKERHEPLDQVVRLAQRGGTTSSGTNRPRPRCVRYRRSGRNSPPRRQRLRAATKPSKS